MISPRRGRGRVSAEGAGERADPLSYVLDARSVTYRIVPCFVIAAWEIAT